MSWTAESEARLITLDGEGRGQTEIALIIQKEFGVKMTRGGIAGKIDRLRKAGRISRANRVSAPSGPTRRRKNTRPIRPAKPRKALGRISTALTTPKKSPRPTLKTEEVNAKAANFGRGVSLINIGPAQCRFPINNPEDKDGLYFCGQPIAPSEMLARKSYCQPHADIATLNRVERVTPSRRAVHLPRLNF